MLKLLSNDYARRKAAKKPAQPVRPPAKFGAADLIRKAQKTVVESNFSLPPLFNATETIEEIVARGFPGIEISSLFPLGRGLHRTTTVMFLCMGAGGKQLLLKICVPSASHYDSSFNQLFHKRDVPGGFRVPEFHGSALIDGWRMELWDFIEGESKDFSDFDHLETAELIRSIAARDALSDITPSQGPNLLETFWLRPMAGRLRSAAKGSDSSFARNCRHIANWESTVLGYVNSFERRCLTHNDLHGHNVIRNSNGFHLVDWDSLSLGTPGASLRILGGGSVGKARSIAHTYTSAMADHGVSLDADKVLFSMRVHQVYSLLRSGVQLNKPDRIARVYRLYKELAAEAKSNVEIL